MAAQSVITTTTSQQGPGHTHAYPFNILQPTGPKQSANKHKADARKALDEDTIEKGVKAPTWLMKLHNYDIIIGTGIDYMHCTLLGITKQLLSLWFGTEHNKENYYLGRQVKIVDNHLKEIKPPSIIHRRPRGIADHFKFFKASELRSFLWLKI